MKNPVTEKHAKNYWLSLSGLFVALLSVYIIAHGWWLIFGTAILLGAVIWVTARYGQFSKEARQHSRYFSPALPWTLAIFVAAGFLARDTSLAPYLAPLLGILGGITMYWILKKNNMYHEEQTV